MSDIKIAPNTKFLSAFLASNIWQTNSVTGTQDNKTTEIVNKNYTIILIGSRMRSQTN